MLTARKMALEGVSILIAIYMKAIIRKGGGMDGADTYIMTASFKKANGRTTNLMTKANLLIKLEKKRLGCGIMAIF